MRHIYHPNLDEQDPRPERNVLRLGSRRDALLAESSQVRARAVLEASPQVKGWLARIMGVSASWSLERQFCRGEWVHEEGWGEGRCLEFSLDAGLYEAECMLYPPVVETAGAHRIYVSYQPHRGIVLLTREQFDARIRLLCEVSFGDIRGLVAQHKWSEAERASRLIGDDTQREAALDYIAQQQERWERGLPELEGSVRQITWASSLRQNGLTALRDYGAGFSDGQGPARQELERAHEWLVSQRAARFWIDHREEIEGAQLWELYLKQQVEH